MACRPDIAIICIWPDYPVEIGGAGPTSGASASDNDAPTGGSGGSTDRGGDFYMRLGHAGILLIKGGTGPAEAVYYEYGRYAVTGGNSTTQGNVRSYSVTGLVLDDTGWPSEQNLHTAIRSITRRSGKNTRLHGNVDHLCAKNAYTKGKAFADAFAADRTQHYNLVSNSCMMFSFKVNHAGGWDWFGPIPIWNSNPGGQLQSGAFSNNVTYNPNGDKFNENVWQISGW